MQETELREKNKAFIAQMKQDDPTFFDELKKGQAPELLVLSCSDSRVSPSVITQTPLGHMFVHRNIANQVALEDESFSASLYYALKHLHVKKIMIKGHTDCGGVKAAWQGLNETELESWLASIRDSLPDKSGDEDGSKEISLDELTKINVLKQIERLKQHPIFQQYGTDVEVLGCLFHVESGELERIYPIDQKEGVNSCNIQSK